MDSAALQYDPKELSSYPSTFRVDVDLDRPPGLESLDNVSASYPDIYADYYNYLYEYEYNASETMHYLPLDEVLPTVFTYTIIGLLGIVGNLLVIFSIARVKRMRSITNLFLLSLASADLLLVCFCVPVKAIAFFSYTWRLGKFACYGVHYVQTVSMVCSALTLTVMSVERFIAIRYPLRARSLCTKRHARLVIVSTWVVSLAAAVPACFAIQYREVGLHVTAYWCHKNHVDRPTYGKWFELYMLLIILVIPVLVMSVTYTWIANIIWHVATRRADMRSGSCISDTGEKGCTPSGTIVIGGKTVLHNGTMVPITSPLPVDSSTKAYMDDDKTRKQVVMMLVTVVIMFAVCWTPLLVDQVLVGFGHLDNLHMGFLKPMRIAFNILAYANSCINPFVYAFMSKNFRDGFKQSVCACVGGAAYYSKSAHMSARSMTSSTRVSTTNGDRIMNNSIAMRRPSEF